MLLVVVVWDKNWNEGSVNEQTAVQSDLIKPIQTLFGQDNRRTLRANSKIKEFLNDVFQALMMMIFSHHPCLEIVRAIIPAMFTSGG